MDADDFYEWGSGVNPSSVSRGGTYGREGVYFNIAPYKLILGANPWENIMGLS